MSEEWRSVTGWHEYEVSDHGRLRRVMPGRGARAGRILRPCWQKYGHVSLSGSGKRTSHRLHVLVLEAFGPPCPSEHHQVNHIDGNKWNNHIDNLEWATPAENVRHAAKMGLYVSGSNHPDALIDEDDVRAIRRRAAMGEKYPSIAADYPVGRIQIGRIVMRQQWTHVE